jgi:hypothetical protein
MKKSHIHLKSPGITSHKKLLTFETNDEHQARSYQNALHYSVITKLS